MKKYLTKSPWVLHYDASSCNGCDIEVLAALCPGFDVERFGIINTGNPKHADIFLVTGSVNDQNKAVLEELYSQMVEPKVVVACGTCACSGGVFHDCYNIHGGADSAIPVDVYVPGCAVRPEAIIDGVVKALPILEEKARALDATRHHSFIERLLTGFKVKNALVKVEEPESVAPDEEEQPEEEPSSSEPAAPAE